MPKPIWMEKDANIGRTINAEIKLTASIDTTTSDPIVELISSNEKTSRKIALEIRKMSLEENQPKEKTVEEICKKMFNGENRFYNDSH